MDLGDSTMKYDKDDKLDMVLEVLKTPTRAKEIAAKYNIGESTLYKWRSRFLTGGKQELLSYKPGPKEKKKSSEETLLNEKLQRYEHRISELAAELEISKKKENFQNEELN
jgi:transposase-like protein